MRISQPREGALVMTSQFFMLVALGAAAGGFINGLAGFGTALFALGFFLAALPPLEAVALVFLVAIATGFQGLWVVRRAIFAHKLRLLRFVLPALGGIYLGVLSLKYVDVSLLKLVIATFLILYGGFFSLQRRLPQIARPTHVMDVCVGFCGGVLGGLAGLSGALPSMWCALKDWSKSETRGVLQPYNFIVLLISAILLLFSEAYSAQTLYAAAIAIPVSLAAAQAGLWVFHKVQDATFRRLIIGLCLISGVLLMIAEVT